MWKSIKKWWRYVAAKLGMKLDEAADPKVQLEQAIREAREQHRKLTEQAANVIANQKQILKNQSAVLANQKTIQANQKAIQANQGRILANQGKLDRVLERNLAEEGLGAEGVEWPDY